MRTSRLLQAVVMLFVIEFTLSCAASKEYTAKILGPRNEPVKDTATTIRFLELEKINQQEEGWVTTDILKNDSTVASAAPVSTAKQKPLVQKDSTVTDSEPVARTTTTNGTRNKTTREK